MKYLLFLRDEAVKKFPLTKEVVILGRDPACDFHIDENFISQKHAKITCFQDHIKIKDLNSKNHIYVEQVKIKEAQINLNESFRIGSLEFILKEGNPEEFAISPEIGPVIGKLSNLSSTSREKTKTCLNLFDKTLMDLLHLGCRINDFEEILGWAKNSLTNILKIGQVILLREEDKNIRVLSFIHLDENQYNILDEVDSNQDLFRKMSNQKIGLDTSFYSFPLELLNCRGTLVYARKSLKPLAKKVLQFLEDFSSEVSLIYTMIEKNRSPSRNSQRNNSFPTIIYKDKTMLKVLSKCKKIAGSDLPALIEGETGTGKELLAKFIHHHSQRHQEKFIAINCSAIPRELMETELFGYEKGAFTDAKSRRIGKLEKASGGTLVLDEIAEMPLSLQAKLLRVLQENEFYRVGGIENVKVNLRVISLTNKNLKKLMEENLFRQDLYYRIAKSRIEIPPLRERPDDIRPLINYFFEKFSIENRIYASGFSPGAVEALLHYPWPGNVRELEGEIEVIMSQSRSHDIIDVDLLSDEIKAHYLQIKNHPQKGDGWQEMNREKEKIQRLLMENRWNKTRVAEILDISRTALYKKLKKLNIQ
jgi:DNA-binding NtrC family response regulator